MAYLKKIFTLNTLFCILISSVACQNTTLKHCRNLNWRSFGVKTAVTGKTKNEAFNIEKEQCSKLKVHIDKASFDEGYSRGLAQFCTTANGFDYGARGGLYLNTCTPTSQSTFLKGFYKGRLKHLESELSKHKGLYAEAEDRLWRKEREYLIIQNDNPEQAKLEVDIIDAYREEARLLAQKKRFIKKEIIKTRRLSAETYF